MTDCGIFILGGWTGFIVGIIFTGIARMLSRSTFQTPAFADTFEARAQIGPRT